MLTNMYISTFQPFNLILNADDSTLIPVNDSSI